MTDFTPCPKTIRLCLEALSKTARIIDPTMKAGMQKWTDGWDAAIEENRAALEALLPDEAEELAREFWETYPKAKGWITPNRDETARWVIDWITQNYTLEKK